MEASRIEASSLAKLTEPLERDCPSQSELASWQLCLHSSDRHAEGPDRHAREAVRAPVQEKPAQRDAVARNVADLARDL